MSGDEAQYIGYVAYPLDLFEEGSVFRDQHLDLDLNATAGTSEGMLYRAETAKMLGVPIIMHDYITGGFTSNTSLAWY